MNIVRNNVELKMKTGKNRHDQTIFYVSKGLLADLLT